MKKLSHWQQRQLRIAQIKKAKEEPTVEQKNEEVVETPKPKKKAKKKSTKKSKSSLFAKREKSDD